MQVIVNKKILDNNKGGGGLEIIIEGVKGDPTSDINKPCPIFIEYYQGEYRVLIWNDTQDPQVIVLEPR